jgi:hypothetical protein
MLNALTCSRSVSGQRCPRRRRLQTREHQRFSVSPWHVGSAGPCRAALCTFSFTPRLSDETFSQAIHASTLASHISAYTSSDPSHSTSSAGGRGVRHILAHSFQTRIPRKLRWDVRDVGEKNGLEDYLGKHDVAGTGKGIQTFYNLVLGTRWYCLHC